MPRQLNDIIKIYMADGDCLTDNKIVFQAGGIYSRKYRMWFPEIKRTHLYRWVKDGADMLLMGAINVQTHTPPAADDNAEFGQRYLPQVIDEYSAGVGEDQLSARQALAVAQVVAAGAGILFFAVAFFSKVT